MAKLKIIKKVLDKTAKIVYNYSVVSKHIKVNLPQ